MYRKTYIEVNTANLQHNVKTIIHNYPDYKYYIGVVKGNAYGHGFPSVKYLIEAGINYLAVSTLEEAISIRKEGIETPILCLQPIHIEDIFDALRFNITLTITSLEYFRKIIDLNIQSKLKIHLKINSGLNRFGLISKEEVLEIFNTSKTNEKIEIEGIYSHFATTGIADKHWDDQLEAFKKITSLININEIPIIHLGRSLTLLNHPKIDFTTGVRIGILMYGYYQSSQGQTGLKAFLRSLRNKYTTETSNISKTTTNVQYIFKPALNLYTEIIETRMVKSGEFVGYGAVFEVTKDTYIGFASIGYCDGFFKKNKGGYVVINEKRYQIISVDMNIITILIDDTIKPYTKVGIIGDCITAGEVARRNSTNVYEILCALKESIPRVLID